MSKDCISDLSKPTRLSGSHTFEHGWLPIVLCPTDQQDRALLLPDGREVVGAFHNPGGWMVTSTVEYDQAVYEEPLRGGFIASTELRPARPEPERRITGHRRAQMHVVGKLPEGVYPTHFRPNDTVYGVAAAQPAGGVGQSQTEAGPSVDSQSPKPDRMERSAISPSSPPPTIRPDTGDA